MKIQEQILIKVHSIGGISFALLFYVIMFFGMFALMQNYIKGWEKPSRHFSNVIKKENIPLDKYIIPIINKLDVPKNNIKIYLPGHNEDNALIIAAPFVEKIVLNTSNGAKIKDESRKEIGLGNFLHNMHTGWQIYKNIGFTVFGLVALASIFLMIIGIIQVIKIKYSNTGTSILKQTSKWHRKLSLWFFLPVLIIFISGAALNLQVKGMKSLSAPLTYYISDSKEHKWTKVLGPTLFPNPKIIKKEGRVEKMLSLDELYKKAKKINSNIQYSFLTLYRWEDSTAQVEFSGYDTSHPFFNGYNNIPSVTLSAVDASLVKETKVFDAHWTRILFDFVNYLHFVPYWKFYMKFILLVILSAFTLATAFGIWLWLEKKTMLFDEKVPFYNFFGRVSMSVILGILPATATLFVLQWTLPFDLDERLIWQRGSFFIVWLSMAVIAFARLESYRAAKDILYIGFLLFVSSPIIHWVVSGYSPIKLLNLNLFNILGVDLALIILSLFCFILAYKLPNDRAEAKKLWKKV